MCVLTPIIIIIIISISIIIIISSVVIIIIVIVWRLIFHISSISINCYYDYV